MSAPTTTKTMPSVQSRQRATPRRVLVLTSSDAASYARVADALERRLASDFDLERATLADSSAGLPQSGADAQNWAAAIAIGGDAAEHAAAALDIPTIFCQVFDTAHLRGQREMLYGVEALPPLTLQLRSWRRIAPEVRSVGILVSERDAALVDAARHAAASLGIELHVGFAASDRETLYRFKRLAPDVDGLWLFPDNDLLSPRILREIFSYARDHRVHTIVFNPALLDWGALLSVGSEPADVAAAVARILDAVTSGSAALPEMTPLSAVDAQVNEALAADLGLGDPAIGARLKIVAR